MKKIQLTFLLALLCVMTLFAQSPPMKWGKIEQDDLEMSIYPQDSGAAAVVLADYGKVSFAYFDHSGINLQFDRHVRIKILKKTGLDQANIEVPLYRKGQNLIGSVKAVTYNLEGGKVKEIKMDKKQVFKEEMNDSYDVMKFTLPAVKEGSVIEYKYSYSVHSEYIYSLVPWEFQRVIPTRWSEFRVEIPEFFHYKTLMSGYWPLSISNTTESFDPNRISVNKSQWAMENVPALKEEPFVTTMDDYKAKIEFELQIIKFPGRMVEHISHTWEKLANDLNASPEFGKQIGKGKHLAELVEEVTAKAASDEEKALFITRYVREHYKYNGKKRLLLSKNMKKILEEKEGNAADLNLLLVSMMQEAGLNASPVVLSTREHGRLNVAAPLLQDLNYVIAHVKIEDRTLLLDGTDPELPLDMLPFYCLNQEGRIISPAYTSFVKVANQEKFKESAQGSFKLREDGSLVGDLTYKENGYGARNTREKIKKGGGGKIPGNHKGRAVWLAYQ